MNDRRETVLLTGATGFVGRNLHGPLARSGREVRCMTRRLDEARRRWPDRSFVQADIANEDEIARALEGCRAAYYLVHGMSEGAGFAAREVASAERFARAAASAGVERVVYLGGVAPSGQASEHLRSRLAVGEALRAGRAPAIELRASMIIGEGSLSWTIVRDLAARLPVMVLPRWLESRTEPVGIRDVAAALLGALDLPIAGSAWFDLPGPEAMTGRAILERTATLLGLHRPRVVSVPVLTPWLSSHWVHLVTRADWSVAREVVLGLGCDLLARDDRFWQLIHHARRQTFEEAAREALAEEQAAPGAWGKIERWRFEHAHAAAG
jgi:uncharacterized protein YbjT (DUF2867 family)